RSKPVEQRAMQSVMQVGDRHRIGRGERRPGVGLGVIEMIETKMSNCGEQEPARPARRNDRARRLETLEDLEAERGIAMECFEPRTRGVCGFGKANALRDRVGALDVVLVADEIADERELYGRRS